LVTPNAVKLSGLMILGSSPLSVCFSASNSRCCSKF